MRAFTSLAVTLTLAGCVSATPPLTIERWVGFDDSFFRDTDPYIYELAGAGSWHELLSSDFTIVRWPQLDPVAAVTEELRTAWSVDPDFLGNRVIRVAPRPPLDDGWYAIRWSGEPLSEQVVFANGVPLSDGSVVWRFDAAPSPQLYEVMHDPDALPVSVVVLDFREYVHAVACPAPRPIISVTQGPLRCTEECATEDEPLDIRLQVPCARLDPSLPFRVVIEEGAVAMPDGALIPAVDVIVSRSLTLPRLRPAPPVPPAVCAGVACEE